MRILLRLLASGAAAVSALSIVETRAQAGPVDNAWGTPFPAPAFPFGAVYFRKSSPPESDWAHDHEVAAGLGMNTFRHWFMWASIETTPDRYDWADYDRMVQLEGQNRIKVIIAENVTGAPEWARNCSSAWRMRSAVASRSSGLRAIAVRTMASSSGG